MKTIIVVLSVIILSIITTGVGAQNSNADFIYSIKSVINPDDSTQNILFIEIDTAIINDKIELLINNKKYQCIKTVLDSKFYFVTPALKFGDLIIVQSKTQDNCYQATKYILKEDE